MAKCGLPTKPLVHNGNGHNITHSRVEKEKADYILCERLEMSTNPGHYVEDAVRNFPPPFV